MKLITELEMNAPSGGQIHSGPIRGLAGFIPVYATIDEALEASEDGKYKIMKLGEQK